MGCAPTHSFKRRIFLLEDFFFSSQSFILAVGLIAAIVDVFEHIRKLLDRSLPLNITNNYFELF